MKKIVSAFVLAAFLAVSLCACFFGDIDKTKQSKADKNNLQQTTVSFWTYCTTPEREADYKKFEKILNDEHPEIKLDYLGVSGDTEIFRQKLDVAIASGTAPDFTDYYDTKYIKSGFYQPLDSYFDQWEDKGKIDANIVNMVRGSDKEKNRLFAIPFSSQPWGMWVRLDLLRSAGLGVPSTWDDFFTAVERLTNKDIDQYGIAIRGGFGSANSLEPLMYAYSGITEYFDKNGKSTINNPKNIEFAERYLELYNKYSAQDDLAKGWTALTASFQAGKAAIIFHNFGSGTSMDAAFSKDITKYEAVMMPKSLDGKQLQFVSPRCVAMNSASKVKDAAFIAMTVYCSPQVQVPRCKTHGEVPTHKDAIIAPAYIDVGQPYIKLAAQIVTDKESKFINSPLYLPEYSKIQTAIEPMIQDVMMGKISAKEMLDSWAEMLEKAKRDYEYKVQE